MQNIIFISDGGFNISQLEKIDFSGLEATLERSGKSLTFQKQDNYVRFEEEDLSSEYDADELVGFPFTEPKYVTATFNSLSFINPILLLLTNREDLWIDNDHGMIVRSIKFFQKLEKEPIWDWRTCSSLIV